MRNCKLLVGLMALSLLSPVFASDYDVRAELEKVKKELEEMRKERAASRPVGAGVVDKVVDNKYGPNAPVTTKSGKLTLGGLVQVWYYSIQNDRTGFFGDRAGGTQARTGDTNEFKDNDSFALRRAELTFNMDIHENVTAFVKIDPACGFVNRPSFYTNLGTGLRSATGGGPATNDAAPANGTTRLQDAYINYHGVIPHHDFQIGQYKPCIGNEGLMNSGALDFAERSMIGLLTDARDIGLTAHGTWWGERFQYWLGVFNTPTSFLAASWQNRADNNDDKSIAGRMLVRPVWKDETWGSLELGGSYQWNRTGEAGGDDLGTARVDGLNLAGANEWRMYDWIEYRPGGPVKGLWLKGEYAKIHARVASGRWTALTLDGQNYWVMDTATGQLHPREFDTSGWYVSTGYKISDSIFCRDVPSWFKPFEFCFRYETLGNIQVAKLFDGTRDLDPYTAGVQGYSQYRHDVWKSSIYTAGINYYIKGHNAKIQVNYSWVNEPAEAHDGPDSSSPPRSRLVRDVRNDNLLVNFQVAW